MRLSSFRTCRTGRKQGRIHGNSVADGWAGAVMQKPLRIQKCDGRTYRHTDIPTDTARCRVACPRLKMDFDQEAPHGCCRTGGADRAKRTLSMCHISLWAPRRAIMRPHAKILYRILGSTSTCLEIGFNETDRFFPRF